MEINIKENVLLSDYTTIGLGGKAMYFIQCNSAEDIYYGLNYAKEKNIDVQVLAGGSNIIFPDNGYKGIILKIDLKGIEINEEGKLVMVKVAAGENWDDLVKIITDKGLTGIECLSGIPGSAGATPIQNVGAYGQEVSDVLISLTAINRTSMNITSFSDSECDFGYRQSRFKSYDKDKYIITDVTFSFEKNTEPEIKYDQLREFMDSKNPSELYDGLSIREKLIKIRESVLILRSNKSMIADSKDPDSKSCGSFFMNPVLSESEFEEFKSRTADKFSKIPVYRTGSEYKIPAAWLTEQAGFSKGYIKGGVGISKKHSLALINKNGTSKELMYLADEIKTKVLDTFGVKLKIEPVVV